MSHDFAKGSKKKTRATATRKAVPKAKTPTKNKAPVLLWITAIVLSILFIAGLILLTKLAPRTPTNTPDVSEQRETQFDFFTLLPETEINIDTPPDSVNEISFEYYLQAGSFKRKTDAETRRGELALLGYESHVTEVIHQGNRWHRVQIGPIATRSRLSAIRGALLENGYDSYVMKQEVP